MSSSTQLVAAPPPPVNARRRRLRPSRRGWWWKVLIFGAILWAITVVVTVVTRNTNLVPSLILMGSFLVPFCVVLFVAERADERLSTQRLATGFFIGGLLGVLGASLLDGNLSAGVWTNAAVGFIDEGVMAVLLVSLGWTISAKSASVGGLLGATIGAGFAAFESAGFALRSAITPDGIDLVGLLQSEVVRGVFAPLGHVLWTAV